VDRGNVTGIVVGCIIAVIGIVGIAMSAEPSTSTEPESTSTYTLSVITSPSGTGWVSSSSGEYEYGDQVTLTASATSGYTFDHWGGDASGTSPTTTITMYCDKSIIANFKAVTADTGVLFSDDFSDEVGDWDIYSDDFGSVFYEDGWLHLINNNPAAFATATWANKHFTDFILEVETKLVGGTDDNWHTVVCRYQDTDNSYYFQTSADGYYSIYKHANGNWVTLGSTTHSSYINQGVDAVNLIHIECISSDLSLSVNGHLLWEGTDATFTGGDILLLTSALAGTYTEVAFDNIVITNP